MTKSSGLGLAVAIVLALPCAASGQQMRSLEPVQPHARVAASPGSLARQTILIGEESVPRSTLVIFGAAAGALAGFMTVERGGEWDFPVGHILLSTLLGAGIGYLVSLAVVE